MTAFNSPPDSISHKQLKSLLSKVRSKPIGPQDENQLFEEEEKAFNELITNWHLISTKLLNTLKTKPDHAIEERSSKSLMALGALEAHLTMAIQAKKASDLN